MRIRDGLGADVSWRDRQNGDVHRVAVSQLTGSQRPRSAAVLADAAVAPGRQVA